MKDLSLLKKKKLAGYSAMAGALIAANHQSADAQVIYHDIIPDTVLDNYLNNYHYELDMNNDGQVDFELSWRQIIGSNGFYGVIAYGGNNSIMLTQYGGPYIAALNSCENISAIPPGNDVWSTYSTVAMLHTTSGFSPWLNNGADKYVALKLHLADGNHYGWLRVTCNPGNNIADGSMALKDYAYQTIPDSAIVTACANQVKDIATPDLFDAYIEDQQLIVRFNQSPLPSQIFLLNEVGIKLREQSITQSELVTDVSQLAAGIYFVVVEDNEKRQVKKVMIE